MNKTILTLRARAGGKARGLEERKEALVRYHTKPHHCLYCHDIIPVGHRRVADVMKKKFCNSSHAASMNNKLYPERYKKRLTLVSSESYNNIDGQTRISEAIQD